jgi:hypothetical protein
MMSLFGGDAVTGRADFRRDALCDQIILRLRRADYRDCGDDSDDATHASDLKSMLREIPKVAFRAKLRVQISPFQMSDGGYINRASINFSPE